MEDQVEINNTSSKIRQLFDEDQKDRISFAKNPTSGLEIRQKDEKRLKKAKEIIASSKLSDPNELNMLAHIFQHGDTIEDYQQSLALTTKAVELGLLPQDSLIPQATDRLIIKQQLDQGTPLKKLTQKYGTQTMFDQDGKSIKPPIDKTIAQEEFENLLK